MCLGEGLTHWKAHRGEWTAACGLIEPAACKVGARLVGTSPVKQWCSVCLAKRNDFVLRGPQFDLTLTQGLRHQRGMV